MSVDSILVLYRGVIDAISCGKPCKLEENIADRIKLQKMRS